MGKAVVVNGVVVNVIVVNSGVTEHDGHVLVDLPEHVGIGWTYDGEVFLPPEPPAA